MLEQRVSHITVLIACIWNLAREFILEMCQIRVSNFALGKYGFFFFIRLHAFDMNFCVTEEDKEKEEYDLYRRVSEFQH